MPRDFGLDGAAKVDRVEVTWPSGVVQVIDEGIPTAGRLEIVEQAGEDVPAG